MAFDLETIQHKQLADKVYEEMRARILRRDLKSESQIYVDQIAAELGVSRTPVLDAVKRLSGEGLVEVRARRGSFVKSMALDDVREIFQIRETFETLGLTSAISEGRGQELGRELRRWIAIMNRSIARGRYTDYAAFTEADRAFHRAIVTGCKNARMLDMYAQLSVHIHIMRVHLLKALEGPDKIQADHMAVTEAVENGNADQAQAALKAHLSAVRDGMAERIAALGGSL